MDFRPVKSGGQLIMHAGSRSKGKTVLPLNGVVLASWTMHARRKLLLTFGLLVAVLFASTCSGWTKALATANKPVAANKASNPSFWPPIKDSFYPEMELINQDGRRTRLMDFKGQVIVVQFVSAQCSLSQAYAGANRPGFHPLGVCFPPKKIEYFPEMMRDFTGYDFNSPAGMVWVQILLYNEEGKPASAKDVKKWADHFELKTANKMYVLAPTKSMMTDRTRLMVPGFQLVSRAFVLVADSTGPLPKDDLYNGFFPRVRAQF